MTFNLKEIVYFDNPDPAYKEQQGMELRIIGKEGAYQLEDSTYGLYGYRCQSTETGKYWIVKGHSLKRTTLERGDMDTRVSWYEFGLATGWHKRPEDLT